MREHRNHMVICQHRVSPRNTTDLVSARLYTSGFCKLFYFEWIIIVLHAIPLSQSCISLWGNSTWSSSQLPSWRCNPKADGRRDSGGCLQQPWNSRTKDHTRLNLRWSLKEFIQTFLTFVSFPLFVKNTVSQSGVVCITLNYSQAMWVSRHVLECIDQQQKEKIKTMI